MRGLREGIAPPDAPFPPKRLPPALRAALCLECGPAASEEAWTRAAALRLWASELLSAEAASAEGAASHAATAAFFGLSGTGEQRLGN